MSFRILSAILLLASLASRLQAGPCSYASTYHSCSYTPYVNQVTVVKEVPVYVAAFIPVVSVGYASAPVAPYQPAAAATAAPAAEPCADLRARLANLERLLQQNSAQPAGQAAYPTPQASASSSGLALLASRCAECHTRGKEKGGIALTAEDGRSVLKLSPEQRQKVLRSTMGAQGKPPSMPKNHPPLSNEEFGQLLESLVNAD
jgi:mono/diheme cytochrome c family protein